MGFLLIHVGGSRSSPNKPTVPSGPGWNRKPDVDVVLCNGDVTNSNALVELRLRLRELREAVGRPTYQKLQEQAELAGRTLPVSTAQELLAGDRRPRWATVEVFVVTAIAYAKHRRPPIGLEDRVGDMRFWRDLYEGIDGPDDPRPDGGPAPAATTYVEFVHAVLHDVARSRATREARNAAGAPAVIIASERLLLRLGVIYEAVRAGARPDSEQYHRAYHPFTDALWAFRLAVRTEVGQPPLTPQALGRVDWSVQERCANCTQSAS
jgi:hypothetical protein